MQFKDRLKILREEQNLTKAEMARRLEVTTGAYSNWEYGNREPNHEMTKKIATVFGVSVSYLLEGRKTIYDLPESERKNVYTKRYNGTNSTIYDEIYKNTNDEKINNLLPQLDIKNMDETKKEYFISALEAILHNDDEILFRLEAVTSSTNKLAFPDTTDTKSLEYWMIYMPTALYELNQTLKDRINQSEYIPTKRVLENSSKTISLP